MSTGGGLLGLANTLSGGALTNMLGLGGGATAGGLGGIVAANNAALLGLGGSGGASATAANVAFLMGEESGGAAAAASSGGAIGAGMTMEGSDLGLASLGSGASLAGGEAASLGATVAGIGPLAGAAAVAAPLVIGSIVQAISNNWNKTPTPDQNAETWANTYAAVLTNYGGLPGAIAYANSDATYAQDWQGYLDTLQRFRTSGPSTPLEQLEIADLNSVYPGWYNLPGWDSFSFSSGIAQRKSDAAAAQALAMTGGSDGGGRAVGGPVWPGATFDVGEHGPEKLTMFAGGGGFVTPNSGTPASAGGGSGGAGTIVFDFRGSTMLSEIPDKIIKQISAALPWRERYLRVRR